MTATDLHPDTGVPRPGTCCGVCPPIAGGGWDCTCPGLSGCPVNAPAAEWDDLARHAEAATPGPWDWRDEQYPGQLVHRMEVGGWPVHPQNVLKCKDDWLPTSADAEFIAAANPATILRLIADNRRLVQVAQSYRETAQDFAEEVAATHAVRDAVAQDLARVAARLAAVEAERDALADEVTRVRAAVAQALRQHPDDLTALEVRAALAAPTDTTKEN